MNTLFRKFLDLFSPARQEPLATVAYAAEPGGMPLASASYLREFAHRLGLEVDDLSPAEQSELKRRLDDSMDFREENYSRLYHEVYELGHGYSLDDAQRVSARINEISAEPAAGAYLDYRENSVAAEALMAAGALLQQEGDLAAGARLFQLADARRHRSSLLAASTAALAPGAPAQLVESSSPSAAADAGAASGAGAGTPADGTATGEIAESGIAMLMDDLGKDTGDSAADSRGAAGAPSTPSSEGKAPAPAANGPASATPGSAKEDVAASKKPGGAAVPTTGAGNKGEDAGKANVPATAPKSAPKTGTGQSPMKKSR